MYLKIIGSRSSAPGSAGGKLAVRFLVLINPVSIYNYFQPIVAPLKTVILHQLSHS